MINSIESIRKLVIANKLQDALQQLHVLLKDDEKLDEVDLNMARLNAIKQQFRQGTISFQEASLNENQIRVSLLTLLREIEATTDLNIDANSIILYEQEDDNSSLYGRMRIDKRHVQRLFSLILLALSILCIVTTAIYFQRTQSKKKQVSIPEKSEDSVVKDKDKNVPILKIKPPKPSSPAIQEKTSSILFAGRVKDESTGTLLGDASINLLNYHVLTDENGYFCVELDENINYKVGEQLRVYIEKKDYIPYNNYFEVTPNKEIIILLKPIVQ